MLSTRWNWGSLFLSDLPQVIFLQERIKPGFRINTLLSELQGCWLLHLGKLLPVAPILLSKRYRTYHRGAKAIVKGGTDLVTAGPSSPTPGFSALGKQMSLFLHEAPLRQSCYKFENFLMLLCIIKILNVFYICDDFLFWALIWWLGIWLLSHLLFVRPWAKCLNPVPQFPHMQNENNSS